jgi:hypothetical protein
MSAPRKPWAEWPVHPNAAAAGAMIGELVRRAMLAEARRREAIVEGALISGAHLRDLAAVERVGNPASWRLA